MRLPSRVALPFGYIVAVRQVTDTEMRAAGDIDRDDEPPDGMWDVETRTIYITKSLPLRRKRYILGHEFGHAFLDWQHECLDDNAMKP